MLGEFTFWDAVGTAVVIMFLAMFVTMFIYLFIDVFSRQDIGGWAKAAWVVALFVFPLVGCLAYIVTRSVSRTHEHVAAMPAPPAVAANGGATDPLREGATQP